MLSSHEKRSPSLWLHNKSRLFHRSLSGVCIINRILHTHLWIWILSHEWAQLTREISSWTLEDKIHIHVQSCNILYFLTTWMVKGNFNHLLLLLLYSVAVVTVVRTRPLIIYHQLSKSWENQFIGFIFLSYICIGLRLAALRATSSAIIY